MTTSKIAITVPDEVLARARAAVRDGRSTSLSAYISAALDQKLMQDDLEELLDEMLRESGGPLTRAELRAARSALALPRAKRRTRRA
jgi:Arc/MetJ-type ribon-helix-helix transcriptional regulator